MAPPYPHQSAYTAQQTMGQPSAGYYQTDAYGQTVYMHQPAYTHDPQAAGREQAMMPAAPPSSLGSWFDYRNPSYIKGLLIGVGATLLVTNPTVQAAVVKGAVSAWTVVVGGIEEIKERIRDARAEQSMT